MKKFCAFKSLFQRLWNILKLMSYSQKYNLNKFKGSVILFSCSILCSKTLSSELMVGGILDPGFISWQSVVGFGIYWTDYITLTLVPPNNKNPDYETSVPLLPLPKRSKFKRWKLKFNIDHRKSDTLMLDFGLLELLLRSYKHKIYPLIIIG